MSIFIFSKLGLRIRTLLSFNLREALKKDPRYKNKGISWSGSAETSSHYYAQIQTIMQSVSSECFDKFIDEIMRVAQDDKLLLLAGNGGSASISNHIACDLSKGTFYDGVFGIRTVSLMSNSAMLTAIGNDFGFEEYRFSVKADGNQEICLYWFLHLVRVKTYVTQ